MFCLWVSRESSHGWWLGSVVCIIGGFWFVKFLMVGLRGAGVSFFVFYFQMGIGFESLLYWFQVFLNFGGEIR